MGVRIYCDDGDDRGFFGLLENCVHNHLREYDPDDLLVVRINNWFDHKWLKFSGIGVVEWPERGVDVKWGPTESALSEFYKDKITFPPFAPNRIRRQQYFRKIDAPRKRHVHRRYRERSARNLQRRVTQYSDSGVFVWFSSETFSNHRGSLMVYAVQGDHVSAWYASLAHKDKDWRLGRVKGVNAAIVKCYLREPST